jgi:uncharacterized protein (TIGR02145 family)
VPLLLYFAKNQWDFYNRRSSVKIFNALALSILLALLAACGDESSSSAPDPIGEISSSSNDDNGSASSSSQKDSKKSSSSVAEKNSSSSVSGKNSSSSVVESSSSEFVLKYCDEGSLDTLYQENRTVYAHCEDGFWETDSIVYKPKEKVYPNMDSLFASDYEPVYSEFEDPRDHQVYKTVILSESYGSADKIEVFAQNLNYGVMIDSSKRMLDDSKVEKRCYQDDPWYCDNYFGALYTWSEALGLPKVCDSVGVADNSKCNVKLGDDAKVQGVCPEGWHVMNETEWKHFAFPRGIDASYTMLSRAVWKDVKNTNSSGMSVLPYGDGTYDSQNSMFWMAHEFKEKPKMGGAFMINGFSTSSASSKYGFLYVRCVMDEGDTFIQ